MEAARIIIVGGGFAGANLAEHLNRRVARDVEVVVISSENHMVFTPMLAEVAGRSLSPGRYGKRVSSLGRPSLQLGVLRFGFFQDGNVASAPIQRAKKLSLRKAHALQQVDEARVRA